jgi:hypothetical protein
MSLQHEIHRGFLLPPLPFFGSLASHETMLPIRVDIGSRDRPRGVDRRRKVINGASVKGGDCTVRSAQEAMQLASL